MVTTSVDAPLHMGGHAIKDARIEGGSATGLAQVAAQVLRLDHAPGTRQSPRWTPGPGRAGRRARRDARAVLPRPHAARRTPGAATIVGDLDSRTTRA